MRPARRLVLATTLLAASVRADVTCTQTGGAPGSVTTATLHVERPEPGITIATTGCTAPVEIAGTWDVAGQAVDYDFYIVIDRSGSTQDLSGADVNGDGRQTPVDNILQAEIAAARAFIQAVPPDRGRVAIISFDDSAQIHQQLGSVADALRAIDAVRNSLYPRGGTDYVAAMYAVEAEVLARGDRANRRQHCVFLSDGRPGNSISACDTAAGRLAALGVVIDTFALGFDRSTALENMARLSGGIFTSLDVPGDIVALLPFFVPETPSAFSIEHVQGGSTRDLPLEDDRSFATTYHLPPGVHRFVIRLDVGDPLVVGVACEVEVTIVPAIVADAGPDLVGCHRLPLVLDAGRSIVPCQRPRYRWIDCQGRPACDSIEDPTCVVTCGGCDRYVLETWCAGEGCPRVDEVRVACTRAAPPVPGVLGTCGSEASVTCGGVPAGQEAGWDLDASVDDDGDGDPANDEDLRGCDQAIVIPPGGSASLAAWLRTSAGCTAVAPLVVSAEHAFPRPLGGGACPGEPIALSCGAEPPGARTEWDLDALSDSDGNGQAQDDADEIGCDVSPTLPPGDHAIVAWTVDASGCRRLVAAGTVRVEGGVAPGEAWNVRLRKSSGRLAFGWDPVPGASRFHVARGTLARLALERRYDHAVEDGCGVAEPFEDGDDLVEPGDFYYLVTAESDCAGGEGPAGFARSRWASLPRPARAPSPGCP